MPAFFNYANRDEAIQWVGTTIEGAGSGFEIEQWACDINGEVVVSYSEENGRDILEVWDSDDGESKKANIGDYIVDNGDGSFRVCKPDEFRPLEDEERIELIIRWMNREIDSREGDIKELEDEVEKLKQEIEELRSRFC